MEGQQQQRDKPKQVATSLLVTELTNTKLSKCFKPTRWFSLARQCARAPTHTYTNTLHITRPLTMI